MAYRSHADRVAAARAEGARIAARQAYLTRAIEERQRKPGAPAEKEAALQRLYRARDLSNRDLARHQDYLESAPTERDYSGYYRSDPPPRKLASVSWKEPEVPWETLRDRANEAVRLGKAATTVQRLYGLREIKNERRAKYRDQPPTRRKRGFPGIAPFEYPGRTTGYLHNDPVVGGIPGQPWVIEPVVRKKRMVRPWKESEEQGDVDF